MMPPTHSREISFGTLRLRIPLAVYEPAEDSFLLATYASGISGHALEIGCGCGMVSLSAAAASPKNIVLGVDINPAAVACAQENAEANSIANARFLHSDLFSAVPKGERFDFILFNPPYLPTTRDERLKAPEENAAYDGGATGLDVFGRFAAQAPSFLADGGKVAAIATSLGDGIGKTLAVLSARVGSAHVLAEEKFFFEKIALIEAQMEPI